MTKWKNVGWDVPHGHSLQARCKDLGLYKLLGETRVLCSNGQWAPRIPTCVSTTLLTNFSGKQFFVPSTYVNNFNAPFPFITYALNRRQPTVNSNQNWHRIGSFWTVGRVGSAAQQHNPFGLHVFTASWYSRMDLDWLASNLSLR